VNAERCSNLCVSGRSNVPNRRSMRGAPDHPTARGTAAPEDLDPSGGALLRFTLGESLAVESTVLIA
jgi:hypothetical protein